VDADPRLRGSATLGAELDDGRVQRSRVAGKSAYMAPEHARGESIDARSDLFSTGIVLWELCAGRRLYRGTDAEMQEQARRGEVPNLPERGFPNHEVLQGILGRALAIDPAARFQSAGEMAQALEEYALSSGLMASQLRFGAFLTDHFAEEIIALRRARERAAEQALAARDVPIAEVEPVSVPSERPRSLDSSRPPPPAADGSHLRRRASDSSAPEPSQLEPQPQPTHGRFPSPRLVLVALAAAGAFVWLFAR
jgi:serine/threonine protein kinase